jgi:hypothetical protein
VKIYYLDCPDCKNSFHCDASLYGLDLPRHCPHCDAYFNPEEKKALGPPRGTAFVGLSKPIRETIYLPKQKF